MGTSIQAAMAAMAALKHLLLLHLRFPSMDEHRDEAASSNAWSQQEVAVCTWDAEQCQEHVEPETCCLPPWAVAEQSKEFPGSWHAETTLLYFPTGSGDANTQGQVAMVVAEEPTARWETAAQHVVTTCGLAVLLSWDAPKHAAV